MLSFRFSAAAAHVAVCLGAGLGGAVWAQPAAAPALSASAAERISAQLTPPPTRGDYAALFRANRFAEIERLATARLAQDGNDAVSLNAKSSAIVGSGQTNRIEEAIQLAERCVQVAPTDSNCHEALGNALGTKALTNGVASALGYATRIRDSYKRAIELNPNNHAARFSLLQYYLGAPGFLGGGKGKAQELVQQTTAVSADAGKLLAGLIALGEKNYAAAEAVATSADSRSSEDLSQPHRGLLVGVAMGYFGDKKWGDADRLFKALSARFPRDERGVYGQARVLAEQGQHAQALPLYDQAQQVRATASVHYRKAQSLQALGQKPAAVDAYMAAINGRPPLSKNQLADAKEQVIALKS